MYPGLSSVRRRIPPESNPSRISPRSLMLSPAGTYSVSHVSHGNQTRSIELQLQIGESLRNRNWIEVQPWGSIQQDWR